KAQRIKPTLYDGSVISSQHAASPVIDDEETLILEEVKLSDEEAFWLQTSHPNTNKSASSPVKIEAPKELPMWITPDAMTEGEWGFEHTKAVFLKEIIPFLKTLTDIFNVFDKDLLNEVTKVQTVFNQMEVAVQQCFVDKQCFEIYKKELFLENDRLLHKIMSQDVMICVMNSTAVFDDVNLEMRSSEFCVNCLDLDAELLNKQNAYNDFSKKYFKNNDVKAQLQATTCKLKEHIKSMRENDKEEKVKYDMDEIETIWSIVFMTTTLQNELRKLKGKNVLNNAATITNATTIALGMFKLDLDPLAPRLLKNKDAYIDSLKYTQDQEDILQGIVEQDKAKQPLDNALDFASKHAKRIQELLVYIRDTCPNAFKPSEKLVAVTPMNKVKKVRFSESLTSLSNIHKQVESSKTPDSNTPVLPSIGLKSSTSASISQPTCNKKNDNISQTPSRNMKNKVVQIVLWYLDSRCSKYMTGNRSQLMNFVSKFLGTVRFENDQIAKIMGYGDYQLGNVTISRVYYIEGLGHNLFSVGKFCDADLEVAFWKNTCFIWNLESVDLLSGSRDTNLYTISLDDMLKTSPICLLLKASKTKSWLWHHRLSHLNFGTLNKPAKDGLARGIPKLKFKKDHLCSACAVGKSKKSSHHPKADDTNQKKCYLLHMDLCGPMRVESINGLKDEAPDAIIKCIKNIQVRLNTKVRNVRIDNGTEFVNQALREFYENTGITHQTSVACTPQQNGVVER
ncbi:retrovirus-related pol polyprotein from transposon TNT 1-94, partial [Tanacetum coccineum]